MGIRENLLAIRQRIERARRNAPNPKEEVLLVGVTKGVGVTQIREALRSGLEAVGENRVQEAREKVALLGGATHWHMVGHLQRNKVKEAIRLFELIHSVDTLPLAQAIEKEAARVGKEVPILLQVNLHGKKTQFGVDADAADRLATEIAALEHVKLQGVMTLAPWEAHPEDARPFFRRLWELRGALEKKGNPRIEMHTLSMGMSQDFEVAVEEGSNLVRIGRAIFG